MITTTVPPTLQTFLQLPETKPATEYLDGQSLQKPIPTTRHSLLQFQLAKRINDLTLSPKIACALPELRCTFAGQSIVLDIAVLLWNKLSLDQNQEPVDRITVAPDWMIEILSPDQSANRVLAKVFFALDQGATLGWLVDPIDRSVLICKPQQQPDYCEGDAPLAALPEIPLEITATQLFALMKMG